MEFDLSPEQETLRETARKFLVSECPASRVRRVGETADAHDPDLWSKIVQMGWLAIPFPEEEGGFGGSVLDLALVCEEAGRALLSGPFLATAALAGMALRFAAAPAGRARLVPALAAGELRLAFLAPGEPYALDAHVADRILLAEEAPDGLALFELDARVPGVSVEVLGGIDRGRRLCRIGLAPHALAAARRLSAPGDATSDIERALDAARALLAAEMAGIAARATEMSIEYAKIRIQFGRPIGAFQAVKHRLVDMFVAAEDAASLARHAAHVADRSPEDLPRAAAMAKAHASDAARRVTSDAIQVHGGIGFTHEHDCHLYHRRALADAALLGSATRMRERLAALF